MKDDSLKQSNEILINRNKDLEKRLKEVEQLQSQLLQNSKMVSIGQLAAGMAHEINNPMSYLKNNLAVLNKYLLFFNEFNQYDHEYMKKISCFLPQEIAAETLKHQELSAKLTNIISDVSDLIKESLEGVQRVTDIVAGLKSFARLDEAELKEANINECIDSTLKVVWNELKYKCTIEKDYADLPLLKCNPGKLNQVFMNLLVNAGQAIETKGTISIKTYLDHSHICIRIKDTGCGIPKENFQTIFEPFFTTKPIGIGTGLGLSISYGIIQKHNGKLSVESELGKGSTFYVSLPLDLRNPSMD